MNLLMGRTAVFAVPRFKNLYPARRLMLGIAIALAVGPATAAGIPVESRLPTWSIHGNSKTSHRLTLGIPDTDSVEFSVTCDALTKKASFDVLNITTGTRDGETSRMVLKGPAGRGEFQAIFVGDGIASHHVTLESLEQVLRLLSKPGEVLITVGEDSTRILVGGTAAIAVPRFRSLCAAR